MLSPAAKSILLPPQPFSAWWHQSVLPVLTNHRTYFSKRYRCRGPSGAAPSLSPPHFLSLISAYVYMAMAVVIYLFDYHVEDARRILAMTDAQSPSGSLADQLLPHWPWVAAVALRNFALIFVVYT
jgi:hypothetical protein